MTPFNRIDRSAAGSLAVILAPLGALLWSGPGLAASGCLAGAATNKLCLSLDSIPADTVQPSGLAGTDTFVKYTAVLSNTALATSRFVDVTFALSPASGFVSFEAEAGMSCTRSGSTVSCFVDKIDRIDPLSLTLIAEAPQYPTTATQLVNTAVFGYQGNTATISESVAVSETSGTSYVPKDTQVTIVTEPETADPADQVTADNPLWGKVTLPAQPRDYYARISVINDGPQASNCVGGLFLSVTDGGPYVCRNEQAPARWVQFDVGSTPGLEDPVAFGADDPMQFTLMWDTSIVPATQLPPTPALPTGTPPFAVFYAQNETPTPAVVVARAFADTCSATEPVPPCLTGVQRFDNGDWLASGLKTNDGSDLLAAADSPVARMYALLNFFMASATALPIKPPIMQ